jgi:hypothetical protein
MTRSWACAANAERCLWVMVHTTLRISKLVSVAVVSFLIASCNQSSTTTIPGPYAAIPTPMPTLPPVSAATPPTPVWTPSPRTKTSGCSSQGGLPDPACTPGAIDPRVDQADIGSTICTSGYAKTVRPPANVTDRIKRAQIAAYGLQGQHLVDYELDHLIPLSLGGAPDDVANLWPQPWNGDANAHMKDAVEIYLNREVCRGAMPLADAQRQIATDWLSVYRSQGLTPAP